MVRETRHLWVGNLPDNIREDRIREHFKRYGRVQNVKLLGRTENTQIGVGSNEISGICATVAFMDIKSASKAHNVEHVLDERTLTTEYYEPAAIPSAAGAPSAGSSPAGSGYSGSSSSVNSTPAPATVSRYHMTGGEDGTGNTCPLAASAAAPAAWRGTNDSATEYCRRGNTPSAYSRYQRNNSTTPHATPPSNVERSTPHHRWYTGTERGAGATGGESTPSTPGGGTESGRRRRHSGSGSSRSDSSSPDPSDTSRASTPATQPTLTHQSNHRVQHQHQWAATASGRPLAICVRNLPTRSTDSSLKDGLYHEYKKHGKVVWVKVVGQNADRYAVVRFKKPSDVEKALEVSQDKLFFGCKISVAPHQSCDEDADSAKPYETDIDEYHPKATRTLFIGNLEKDVTQQQLRDKFKHFGRIIEIDIKKGSGGGAGYAFCQYASISSVVEAIRAMDGEYVGGSRVKLGFGKPVATTCVWVDGLTEHTEKQVLGAVSRCGAATSVCVDRAAGAALVHFEQAAAAGAAVRELRRVAAAVSATEPDHPRLCVDYASRECQDAFYEQLEKHGGSAALTGAERLSTDVTTRYLPSVRHEPIIRYDGCSSVRSRASSFGRSSSRTPRYSTIDHYDPADYVADRRYRVYDELGSSPPPEETTYEDRLQSVVVSPHRGRKHCRDSSSEDKKHSKERHIRTSVRRSRSGSRGAGSERHSARRRHRRRLEGSGSRAGTPLRDEPDTLPVEPRRPPRERPPLPMSLPLPKFAAQLLRTVPVTPRPMPSSAPDSPPRPPSVSSSSSGSAPHSPSLEERIRSLDEKYEKWSGSRALADAPDRTRLRHRLLEIDINEVKPSEVVRSLLAKRSVFDEDSERLESVVRPPSPSPGGSPRSRSSCTLPCAQRYSYSSTSSEKNHISHLVLNTHGSAPLLSHLDAETDISERPSDPRLNRPERLVRIEKLGTFNESDYRLEPRFRPRTPSTDRSQPDSSGRISPLLSKDHPSDESKDNVEMTYRDSLIRIADDSSRICVNNEVKESEGTSLDCSNLSDLNSLQLSKKYAPIETSEHLSGFHRDNKMSDSSDHHDNSARDVLNMLLKRIEQYDEKNTIESLVEKRNEQNPVKENCEQVEDKVIVNIENKFEINCQSMNDSEKNTEILVTADINKVIDDDGIHHKHNNFIHSLKASKELKLITEVVLHQSERNCKEKYNHNNLDIFQHNQFDIESIETPLEKDKHLNNIKCSEKNRDTEKNIDDRAKSDRGKSRHVKESLDSNKHDCEKSKSYKNEKNMNKIEKEKKSKEDERTKEKREDRDDEKITKHHDEKIRHDHHKKDKRKDSVDDSFLKFRKDERHKHERAKKDSDSKRDSKKESDYIKIRKSSRDETAREISRKDSTDSSASRTSHDSSKIKEIDDIKEEIKYKSRQVDLFVKDDVDKDFLLKPVDLKLDFGGIKIKTEFKTEIKEKDLLENSKTKIDNNSDSNKTNKYKSEIHEKQRHYSLDSPSTDNKRKERLNSCSSLPSNIGHKRRMSSQESLEYNNDDFKKYKNDIKFLDRRDSKDSRIGDRHKTTKFSKGHFAKIIESKTKDDKKNQVKPPDDTFNDYDKESDNKEPKHCDRLKTVKTSSTKDVNDKINAETEKKEIHANLDFLATLELRSSEEDEKQKALRKEMKEKKRIQQLQQIQELQMQQDALQQAELIGKLKDDKKQKNEEKKKEIAREKRMSSDRKSREEKTENTKRKNRKVQSSDSSDSDEPKKHSIFDIIDDGPTYISMYDKVKARSCKNMQKQEEEKRQEKIKAKFTQLKQSRAKREEKKRSSWDEDSDSDQDKKNTQKSSIDNSSDDDDDDVLSSKKHDKSDCYNLDHVVKKNKSIDFDPADEEHLTNKLSRKNSRSRIISDTSEDETSRSLCKSTIYTHEVKKECISDSDSQPLNKNEDNRVGDRCDKPKKNSLLSLFGKSDGEETKSNCNLDMIDYKSSTKSMPNDFSSESDSTISCQNPIEMRKKHKKRQRKHKSTYSGDETKLENKDLSFQDDDDKHRIIDKQRRYKKEKRKDKVRDSVDTDDNREDKIKPRKEKKSPNNHCLDYFNDMPLICVKKDGKMEDIFGPLSDDSDRDTGLHGILKSVSPSKEYDSDNSKHIIQIKEKVNNINCSVKEKDEIKKRKERKRKEKRSFKDDDNSLDVDAVSKAIEARLFAESITDDENLITIDSLTESVTKNNTTTIVNSTQYTDSNLINNFINNEKLKKECREKRKKRKKNKEERTNRKDNIFYSQDKPDNILSDIHNNMNTSNKMALFNNSLPNDSKSVSDNPDDCKSLSMFSSLPRLIDSLPLLNCLENSDKIDNIPKITNIDDTNRDNTIINTQVVPTTIFLENIDGNATDIPISNNDTQIKPDQEKIDAFVTSSGTDSNQDAVRSICNLNKKIDNIIEKPTDINDTRISDKKLDEKPRAMISQEETEDAVAALLGESFGGKIDTFASCYEKSDDVCTNANEIVNSSVENENIPEEDAEEMRQAVQNLNASEMEMKPDTPVSDNDLLLIDTDTEEIEESPQDAIESLPVNIIATTQSLTARIEQTGTAEVTNIIIAKPKQTIIPQSVNSQPIDSPIKLSETESNVCLDKMDNIQAKTSTATPVITSWTLRNNKILDTHAINVQGHESRDKIEKKSQHITANIIQIKSSQSVQVNNTMRPIVAPTRVTAPYQVINQIIRPQVSNLQPPTIKIPEPHIMYQKQGVVISPRMPNDQRLLSPKTNSQAENITPQRLSSMPILNTTSPNLSSVGLLSPNVNSIQQRSPGQMTVVRMQQPPLSPIQTVHLSHGARTMVSPNRANSVLVQAQRTPLHFNRLPVTPILAPISKQITLSNIIQQNKSVATNTSIMSSQKIMTSDNKKNDQRKISDSINETSKIILTPTTLQHSTNPTVMAQNRLISKQNALHVGSINSALNINNKVLINAISQTNDKREIQKSEQLNSVPFCSTPIIHVAGVKHSTASIIQNVTKPIMCGLQDSSSLNRNQSSNVIHTINSQRLITSTSLGNVIQLDPNKGNPSVLSMAPSIRPAVLASLDSFNPTTNNNVNTQSKVLKINNFSEQSQCLVKSDAINISAQPSISVKSNLFRNDDVNVEERLTTDNLFSDSKLLNKDNISEPIIDMAKGETDYEELLKDNTNEIKITKDPEKILEINVGKTVILFPTNTQNLDTLNNKESDNKIKKEVIEDIKKCDKVVVTKEQCLPSTSYDENNKPKQNSAVSIDTTATSLRIKHNDICPDTTTKETELKLEDKESSIDINEDLQTTLTKFNNIDEIETFNKPNHLNEDTVSQIKNIDDIDNWNTNDLNIESVIKKVDYLCNENTESSETLGEIKKDIRQSPKSDLTTFVSENTLNTTSTDPSNDVENLITDSTTFQDNINKPFSVAKRGGRGLRGKKTEKSQDRVQTRQISKVSRGGAGKRGRGRVKVDKKIKSFVKIDSNNMPGDVYDFHEDSGDETATSLNKAEARPRLILTIKSPLSGHSNMTATSTLSIAQKDQNNITGKLNKEQKNEDFVSPSPNTRKSRRLQEKDVQRSSIDEVIDDVVKVSSTQVKPSKELNKKRPTRLVATKTVQQEKIDVRKSPRGVKRTRDRSLSDASTESGDEKQQRKDEECTASKVPHPQETITVTGDEPDLSAAARIVTTSDTTIQSVVHSSTVTAVVASTVVVSPATDSTVTSKVAPTTTVLPSSGASNVPTPITKPPKKMISEISAKLACALESQQQATGVEAQHGGEAVPGHRAPDIVPSALMPVGATEASDARVQSPALPHRPPLTPSTPTAHRPADRATPILVRNGEGDGMSVSSTGVAACASGGTSARSYRPYLGTASLPRGAHHPSPDPLHHHVKQVAVVGPHLRHHHPGSTGSRVTITNVPSISPQGQMSLSTDLVRSPPPAHQQTSPVISVYNNGEGMYPHFSHQHYQMYQQHFRATQQEVRTSASPFSRSLEAEGCEAPTPPLELRRPPSARVPRPAHSPAHSPSPLPLHMSQHISQDRLIMYGTSVSGVGAGRSPPPAHGTAHAAGIHRLPHVPLAPAHVPVPSQVSAHVTPHGPRLGSALPPLTGQGPPHASQVPREADSLQMLLTRYPVMWQGLLALKNDSAAVQMHFVDGNPDVATDTLSRHADHSTPLLRIAQRMRLEPTQLDQVNRKMKLKNEHCMLLALPCGRDHMDVLQQSTNLTSGFITYLQRKQAAGIVNIAPPGHHQAMFTVHIFPSCDFANENLDHSAPDLKDRVAHIAHLLIVIATV